MARNLASPTLPGETDPPSLRAWRWIANQEGGGVVHTVPGDPGGTTKWGFAQHYNPDIDVTLLTFASAYLRFCEKYWAPLQCQLLPFPVALALADYAFNAGADDAIPDLQRVAGSSVDGRMGPRTINAILTRYAHDHKRFLNDYLSYRILKYASSDRRAGNRGWFVRTLALRGSVEMEMSA